jgi:hypothetical protein
MSLPTNNKKNGNGSAKNQKAQGKGSKFITTSSSSKPLNVAKKVRSTGANRGS